MGQVGARSLRRRSRFADFDMAAEPLSGKDYRGEPMTALFAWQTAHFTGAGCFRFFLNARLFANSITSQGAGSPPSH
jgi:hypothetical protein